MYVLYVENDLAWVIIFVEYITNCVKKIQKHTLKLLKFLKLLKIRQARTRNVGTKLTYFEKY